MFVLTHEEYDTMRRLFEDLQLVLSNALKEVMRARMQGVCGEPLQKLIARRDQVEAQAGLIGRILDEEKKPMPTPIIPPYVPEEA